jgi:hypothetical protein
VSADGRLIPAGRLHPRFATAALVSGRSRMRNLQVSGLDRLGLGGTIVA